MANKFTVSTGVPARTNKAYISTKFGGTSMAIIKDNKDGWTLPNCVAFVYGRATELLTPLGIKNPFITMNGKEWWTNTKDGCKRGQTPKYCAIACFDGGSGLGHVGIVEEIDAEQNIVLHESYANGAEFGTKKLYKKDNYQYGGLNFQGFIYMPVEFEPDTKQAQTDAKNDYNNNTIENRFKVKKDGKQIGAYTSYKNAVSAADANGGIVVDGSTGKQIYPEVKETSATTTIKTGTKYSLKNTPVYCNENGKADGKRTGTYYVWDGTPTNGYVKMTSRKNLVGVKGCVSFFVKTTSLKK